MRQAVWRRLYSSCNVQLVTEICSIVVICAFGNVWAGRETSSCLLHAVRDGLGPAGGQWFDGGEVQDWEEQMVLPEAALLKALCKHGRETLLHSMAPKLQQLQNISGVGSCLWQRSKSAVPSSDLAAGQVRLAQVETVL